MTDEDAIAWVKSKRIRVVAKRTTVGNQPGWRFRILRTEGQPKYPSQAKLNLEITGSRKPGMAEVLRFISDNAWEKFLTRKRSGPLSNEIWAFFFQTELKELYELSHD